MLPDEKMVAVFARPSRSIASDFLDPCAMISAMDYPSKSIAMGGLRQNIATALMRRQAFRWLTTTLLTIFLLGTWHHRWFQADDIPKTSLSRGPRQGWTAALENGFLPLERAQDVCAQRRWEVYETRDQPRKVYDLFLINTELDWLEIRLHELVSQVDYFIIIESERTFQSDPKPLYFQQVVNESRWDPYRAKIVHQVLDWSKAPDYNVDMNDTWSQEHFTRNALFDQALLSLSGPEAPGRGDVLLISDIDEIPRTSTLVALRNCAFPQRVTLRSQFYYYSYQWVHRGLQWAHPQATYFDGAKDTLRPNDLRWGIPDADIFNAARHCSSCLRTLADMKNKITSFSHKEFHTPYFLDTQRLLRVVRMGVDLFERNGEIFDRIDDNPDVPPLLLEKEGRERFAYVLDRDPANANFQDI